MFHNLMDTLDVAAEPSTKQKYIHSRNRVVLLSQCELVRQI